MEVLNIITSELSNLKNIDEILNYFLNFQNKQLLGPLGRKELRKYFYFHRIVLNFENGNIKECKKDLRDLSKYLEVKKISEDLNILDSSMLAIQKISKRELTFNEFIDKIENPVGSYDFLYLKENYTKTLSSLDLWVKTLFEVKDRLSFIQLLINLELIAPNELITVAYKKYRQLFPLTRAVNESEGLGTRIFKLPVLDEKKEEKIGNYLFAQDRMQSKVYTNQFQINTTPFVWDNSEINQKLIVLAIKEKSLTLWQVFIFVPPIFGMLFSWQICQMAVSITNV